MKNKKRLIILIISIIIVLVLTVIGYNFIDSKEEPMTGMPVITTDEITKDISINIYGKDTAEIIYSKDLETDEEYLVEVLKNIQDISLVIENGDYGAYITSIMNIEQSDGYYWMYYINNVSASVGISNCKIEDNATYDFKIEKY